jgi:peptidyl-prolyl cis-trans isomerase D
MLNTIRKNTGSWLIKFILGVIVIVFVFWGIGSFRSQRLDVLTKVNGEEILMESYRIAYSNYLDNYKRMFGGQIPEGFLDKIDIKQHVLNNLIEETLIRQAASEMGILITDVEVQNTVLSIPAFKLDGVFDQRLYERSLAEAGLTPTIFEDQVRQQLLTEKLKMLLFSGLTVTDAEARQHYMFENEQINLSYISINSSEYEADINATQKDLTLWYESHSEKYMTEPQIKLRYLILKNSDIADDVNVTDVEVKAYYNDHKSEYEIKERRRARHILLKTDPNADQDSVEKVRKKAEKILHRIEKGEDFAKLAKEHSEDIESAKNGGDLGFFVQGNMIKSFEDAVFSMKEGEVSQPILTRLGWHIIKLEETEPGRIKPLAEVKSSIVSKLNSQKAQTMLWDQANDIYGQVIQLGSLKAFAEQHNVRLKTTELFSQKDPPAEIAGDPELLSALFSLSPGELSSLLQVNQGILIAEMLDKKMPYLPPLKEVEEQVKTDFIREKTKDKCRLKAQKILQAAKRQGLEVVGEKEGIEIKETGFFKRTDKTANGKLPSAVAQAGCLLYEGKVYYDEVLESGDRFYILAFKNKKDANIAAFSQQKDDITKKILEQKQLTLFKDWLKHRWEKASIKQVTEI